MSRTLRSSAPPEHCPAEGAGSIETVRLPPTTPKPRPVHAVSGGLHFPAELAVATGQHPARPSYFRVVDIALRARVAPREWVLPLRQPEDRIRSVTHVRSTPIVTAQGLLRSGGKFEEYCANLPRENRSAVFGVIPGAWVPVETALAHHRAIDALRLAPSEQIALATASGEKMQSALTGTIFRMSREIGVTPWVLLPHGQRIWDRICRGGDVSVEKVGPKEATVRMYGLPLVSTSYFRVAIRYVLQSTLSHWCSRCYVTEVASTPTTVTFREAWA